MVRQHVVVHGAVQGVGYRYNCEFRARELGVNGWVRNREDGAVEAVYEGDESAVARMVEWSRNGPRFAEVSRLDVQEEEPEGIVGFGIRF